MIAHRHREAHGVEPICKVLQIAPSTYYDHVARRRDPARLSARAKPYGSQGRVFEENFRVYGVRNGGNCSGNLRCRSCTVERLMREMGLQGDPRQGARFYRRTVSDKAAPCPLKIHARTGCGSRTLPTWPLGWLRHVAFVIDAYARRIVGWRVEPEPIWRSAADLQGRTIYLGSMGGLLAPSGQRKRCAGALRRPSRYSGLGPWAPPPPSTTGEEDPIMPVA